MDFNKLSKEELIKLLNDKCNKELEKRATLKELTTTHVLKDDTLFIVPGGYLIGKPFIDDDSLTSGYIVLSDVILLNSLTKPINITNFNNNCFNLAINQIIAFIPIDRVHFLSQIEAQQKS